LGDGSLIWLRTPRGTFTYKVALMRVVHETQTAILRHPRRTEAAPRLTLYTCTLPKTEKRLVVVANLVRKRSSV
jgi:LPXTG-site transpeptidase (sortase) family protein